jgi:hypothetical protein
MTPHSFSTKEGITTFHYHFSQLRDFITRGRNNNAGHIIIKRDQSSFTYKGFVNGTIFTTKWMNNQLFDNNISNEQICTPPDYSKIFKNTKFIFIDTDNNTQLNQNADNLHLNH